MKRQYYIFQTLIILAILNVLSGYIIDPDNMIGKNLTGLKWQDPKIYIFNLNPRIDRFIYWIIEDSIICMLFMIQAMKVIRLSYSTKIHRAIAWLLHSYFFVEMGNGIIIQLFNAGISYNDKGLLIITALIFVYRLRYDIYLWLKMLYKAVNSFWIRVKSSIKRFFSNLIKKKNAGKTG